MIKLKSMTIRNFISIGNVAQKINFNTKDLFLVLGENIDQGGNDNRNGAGKSAIVNALSYVLYGDALTNIRRDNLVNKTNDKGMMVTIEFDKNGNTYKIERGRKPNKFKFHINGKSLDGDSGEDDSVNESQGEGKHTQEEIVKILGLSHEMFKNIVALNTYNIPFLSMKANEQREIIEELLGITKLSEKAELLKENIRKIKEDIHEEEVKIKTLVESNKRIEENIRLLKIKSDSWDRNKIVTLKNIRTALDTLLEIDVDNEIVLHKDYAEYLQKLKDKKELEKTLADIKKDMDFMSKNIEKIKGKQTSSEDKKCYACGQDIHKDLHKQHTKELSKELHELESKQALLYTKQKSSQDILDNIKPVKVNKPFYETIEEAYNHRSSIEALTKELEKETNSVNPYIEQIQTLKESGIQEVSYSLLNHYVDVRDHEEFLLKLLTSKDSFIRKKIIDRNLGYLNKRLEHYLIEIGLPHKIRFLPDLTVEISQLGRDLDFDNLSRGERTRLILSLSLSFRDVFETMNDKINLLFIDELIDNGLDSSGVESALSILKKMNRDQKRDIFLISHRDELVGRVTNVLHVVKENGFTTFNIEDTHI